MDQTIGKVLEIDLNEEMKRSYIDYAMSVIVSRALPDVRDGLKPVQRRILYAMHESGNTPDKPFKKSARTVGDVIGKYHPHGEAAVYDTLVRLAQDFNMRHVLVEGQGNFGSVDGDPAAAMRYTEARLSRLAMHLLADIDRDTVDFQPNFDETEREPKVLPSRFPNLLVNGATGIAVGMATNMPPHNLGETINAAIHLIDHPEATVEELLRIIPGPDFPTGALILGREGIRDMYLRGRGSLKQRAVAQIETTSGGRSRIVVTELPYQINKAKLLERIAELVRERQIEDISDLRDESDRNGLRVVIELKRDANARVVLNQLYKHTQLQQNFGAILLALVDGRPRILNLKDLLVEYIRHQREVVTRRTRFDLAKAEARAHILEGLRIALDHIDQVVALIRASHTVDQARQGLMGQFGLSEKQADAILEMRLQRLTGLERDKIEEEYAEVVRTIEYLRAVLASDKLLMNVIRKELSEIRDKFGEPRRTRIVADDGELAEEDLIAEEDVVVTLTHGGYVKRMPVATYRSQRRGGRGITGMGTKEEDYVEHLATTTTHHLLLFFTNRGKVYGVKVHELPDTGRQAKGMALVNLIQLEGGEKAVAMIPVRELDTRGYLLFATVRGKVKKTDIGEYSNLRASGLIALGLEEGDELIGVRTTDGQSEVLLVSRQGQCIRFHEEDARPMGRPARGVTGMALDDEDEVIGLEVVKPGADLLVVTARGFGKRTDLAEYPTYKRGARGVRTIQPTEKIGPLVGIKVVQEGNEVLLVTEQGIMLRTPVAEIRKTGRIAQGVMLQRLEEGDRVSAVAQVVAQNGAGEAS